VASSSRTSAAEPPAWCGSTTVGVRRSSGIKEGKNAVKWTRLSCHDFEDNQVRLQRFALAYNLGNFLRRLALPPSVRQWSLTTLREKLVKIGAKVISSARYVVFQMAEVAVPRGLFRAILERIHRLWLPQRCPDDGRRRRNRRRMRGTETICSYQARRTFWRPKTAQRRSGHRQNRRLGGPENAGHSLAAKR